MLHPRRSAAAGRGFALGAALLFSINGTISKLVLQAGLPADRLTAIRTAGAALGLGVIVGLTRPRSLRITRRELPLIVGCGLAGVAVVQWLYFVAISRLPVGVGLLLEFTAPVIVAAWTRFGFPASSRRPVHRRVWVALALGLGGLAVLAEVWAGMTLDALGLAAGLAAAIALAAFYLLSAHGVRGRDGASFAVWIFAVGALFWAVVRPWWTFPFDVLGESSSAGPPVWLLCIGVVVIGTVLPYLCAFAALARLTATGVSILGTAEPVIAGAVAWLVLGEVLAPAQLLGGAVVLVGIVMAQSAPAMSHDPAVPHLEGVAP
jgi:drug/metabolite transporter (DMT)-like permease